MAAGASLFVVTEAVSGEAVGGSGAVVLASVVVRGGRPWTAEALLKRAITFEARGTDSLEGVDLVDSADDVCVSMVRP